MEDGLIIIQEEKFINLKNLLITSNHDDSITQNFGIIHSGWRGIVNKIAVNAISVNMTKKLIIIK